MKWPFPQQRSAGPASTAGRTARPGQPARPHTPPKQPAPLAAWRPGRMWLIFVLVLLVNFAITRFFAPGAETPIAVPYTVFKQEVTRGNVEAIYSRGADVEGQFGKA